MTEFDEKYLQCRSGPLTARGIQILQLNLGYQCNMTCKHCHIEAGPHRTELMSIDVINRALSIAVDYDVGTLDLTGGAPELNPHIRYLIREAGKINRHIIVRTNLTILFEEGMEDLPEFYSGHEVEIVASLPHYTKDTVDKIRGISAFEKSIKALKKLNSIGYGIHPDKKRLNLVYNPMGAFLPSSQKELEEQYKKELQSAFGIQFNRLYTFANMPIGRFKDFLIRSNNLNKYMDKIRSAFNPDTLENIMCRRLISIGWDGTLYDCDFNQILGLTVDINCPDHIRDFDYGLLAERRIMTDNHCFACTAGQGST
jgi:radical SAM/Cys-rich protein